jgi:hypothetical protein
VTTQYADFLGELGKLRGVTCWGVVAGEGTGSRATLHFGKKFARVRPLNNPTLSDTLRRFEGEFVLFVQNCAWRLETDKVICSSKSPNDSNGALVEGLRSLVDQRVVSSESATPGYDLLMEFSTGARLRLFSDCFDEERDGDNYSLHSTSQIFTVRAGFALSKEVRRSAQG